ncbi:2Fe-2S iron-sulfur cluster-binding protein [Cochlodiniinecator piscidefendens]|uniref:2Fe-2S iron-sulfur cluster-binding protein n=1 Tax=Cochlodiniinecator piscidefendens TaxID=2715756 RepID=UPI001409B784|nr:2Fe-2S iron-sulfur cluster-binding protein [Cochlodiniinecator piscidefendens]
MSQNFYALTVSDVRDEIEGQAKTIAFDVADRLADVFRWRAGQHLSLRFRLNGQEERRSYSISSSPVSGARLQITVKRVKYGCVSNHINDSIAVGDTIDVMPPHGRFVLDTAPNLRRSHYFFGAGSGITPLFSMLHSVLCNEPHSVAYLAYGNRAASDILFGDALDELLEMYDGRLIVRHILSAPSMWSGFEYWRKGKVDADAVKALIDEHPPYAQDTQYYVCGPGKMNVDVQAILGALDVPKSRIHSESYGQIATLDDGILGVNAEVKIHLDGTLRSLSVKAGQTVLDAARKAGLAPPFSCQSGVCGACRAKISKGTVHMRARMALDDVDIENGDILTCQSLPMSNEVTISFD